MNQMSYPRKSETVVDPLVHFSLKRDQHRQAQEFHHAVQLEIKTQTTGDEPASFFTDITRCTRILIAKSYNQIEALETWKKWIQWRVSKKPYKISEDQIKASLLSGKAYYFGEDREGCPCLYIIMSKIDSNIKTEVEILFGIYMLEQGCKLADQNGPGQLNVILDMKGYNRKNMTSNVVGVFIELLKILQDNYPERLRRLLVLNATWLFKIVYATVKPFMSQRTQEKFIVRNDHKILHDFIDKDKILAMHEGNSTWEYKWPQEKEIQVEEKLPKPEELKIDTSFKQRDARDNEEEEEKGELLNIETPEKKPRNRDSASSIASSGSEKIHLRPSMNSEAFKQKKETIFEGDIYYDCTYNNKGFYHGGLNTGSDLIPFEKLEEEQITSTGVVVGRCSMRC